jgi:galactokinase
VLLLETRTVLLHDCASRLQEAVKDCLLLNKGQVFGVLQPMTLSENPALAQKATAGLALFNEQVQQRSTLSAEEMMRAAQSAVSFLCVQRSNDVNTALQQVSSFLSRSHDSCDVRLAFASLNV